jgi:uncharacterized protein (DUF3820 family)
MPFGKYEEILIDLPEYYVVWYTTKGFKRPTGRAVKTNLRVLKLNGLEDLIRNIKEYPKPH